MLSCRTASYRKIRNDGARWAPLQSEFHHRSATTERTTSLVALGLSSSGEVRRPSLDGHAETYFKIEMSPSSTLVPAHIGLYRV